jgi:magnesium transporter
VSLYYYKLRLGVDGMTAQTVAGKGLEVRTITRNGLTWTNIERPTMAEMDYLRERYRFHPMALEDCLSRVQLPKIDEYDDHIFLVLHFPVFHKETRITQPSQVSIFAGANSIVTIHRGELKPLLKLFQDCESSETIQTELMSRSPGFLLYRILDVLVDYCFPIVNKVIENVDRLEERLFERRRGLTAELSIVRRDIIAFRRIIRPQIEVMETLERKEYPFLKVDPDVYFGDLADHTRRIWEELEELKEVADGLNDTLFTMTSNLNSEVLRILTIIFTVLLPVMVISSLYGMNVPLPHGSDPGGHFLAFWIVLLIAGAVGGIMLLWFRLMRWL